MYNKIVNPITGHKVNVHSKLGKHIINNYANHIGIYVGGNYVEKFQVNDLDVEFVIFDSRERDFWDQKYVDLIENTPRVVEPVERTNYFTVGRNGKKYTLLVSRINEKDGKIIITDPEKCMMGGMRKMFLKAHGLPEDTPFTKEFVEEYIRPEKETYMGESEIYSSHEILGGYEPFLTCIIVVDNLVVGYTTNTINLDSGAYIAFVMIHPDWHGKKLCGPLVTKTIKKLKEMGHREIRLQNVSDTGEGIPACLCYYRAAVKNGFQVWYEMGRQVYKMTEELCFNKNIDTGTMIFTL